MSRFEHTIDIDVPIADAYDQWTQFESFPYFMEGVKSVEQLDAKTLSWVAEIAGQERSWIAVITDQTPQERIAWKAVDGAENAGAVMFEPIDDTSCRVTLRIETEPQGLVETAGDALGFVERQTREDLERFKAFIEARREPTGAWRGEIHGSRVDDRSAEPTNATVDSATSRGH